MPVKSNSSELTKNNQQVPKRSVKSKGPVGRSKSVENNKTYKETVEKDQKKVEDRIEVEENNSKEENKEENAVEVEKKEIKEDKDKDKDKDKEKEEVKEIKEVSDHTPNEDDKAFFRKELVRTGELVDANSIREKSKELSDSLIKGSSKSLRKLDEDNASETLENDYKSIFEIFKKIEKSYSKIPFYFFAVLIPSFLFFIFVNYFFVKKDNQKDTAEENK
jgi:hypothetical protein